MPKGKIRYLLQEKSENKQKVENDWQISWKRRLT